MKIFPNGWTYFIPVWIKVTVRYHVVRMHLKVATYALKSVMATWAFVAFLAEASGPPPISSLPAIRKCPLPWVTCFKPRRLWNHGLVEIFLATAW